MPADKLLGTLLRSLQTYTDQQDTPRLLSTAASLLTTLTNPLNVTLLTTQLLVAPALWARPEGLRTCLRFMSVFHSSAIAVHKHHKAAQAGELSPPILGQAQIGGGLSLEEWVNAVVKGADERSPRWKHLMILGGLLVGFESQNHGQPSVLSGSMRATLETGLIQAANLALLEAREWDELGGQCVALVLNHSFGILSEMERAHLDYDHLLPVLIGAAFFSPEGYQSAYFLGAIDLDVVEVPGKKFSWLSTSTSFKQVQRITSLPLVTSMGPLSRLIAHSIENIRDPWLIQTMMEDLASFSRALMTQWRQNKLSEVDASEETEFLDDEALRNTLPLLWKLLKSILFTNIIVLRGVMGRMLGDRALAADGVAPVLAAQGLQTLRSLYFVSSRMGPNAFSQYNFVYLTAIDILTQYPIQADAFVKDIRPAELGQIPQHPLDRCLDLYFLNTAEHFALVLSPQTNEELLVSSATPYLAAGGNNHLLPIFEAAHSVMLSVLSSPQSAEVAFKHLPFYVDALFRVFPDNLSPRQFRLAFKTLLRVTAPPSHLSATHPDLPATLLEIVHHRALKAPTTPMKPNPTAATAVASSEDLPPLSEQAVLALTLLDALPFLPLDLLEEWLPLCAELINAIADKDMKESCKKRFWEVLISGEMDPERSQICVAWWGTRGGKEMVIFGEPAPGPYMSGVLVTAKPRETKL